MTLPTIKQYQLQEILGEGKFGVVYKGYHTKTREPVAIKIETEHTPFKMLKHETSVLNILGSKRCRNIPPVYWYGAHNRCNVLVMPHYDYSLDAYLRQLLHNCAPLSSLVKIYKNMVYILSHIHKHYVVHRDIKPHNFMLKGDELVLIDFGFSSFYVDSAGKHIAEEDYSDKEHLLGTLPYISYFVHCGYCVTRRDDVMSVIYILIYSVFGHLYWEKHITNVVSPKYPKTSIHHPTNQRVKELKSPENVCAYVTQHDTYLPKYCVIREALRKIVEYVYGLSFMEMPNYDYLGDALDAFL